MAYVTKKERKVQIVLAASGIAKRQGLHNVTLTKIAEILKVDHTLVLYHMGNIDNIKKAVVEKAVADGSKKLMIEGVTLGFLKVEQLPGELKEVYAQLN